LLRRSGVSKTLDGMVAKLAGGGGDLDPRLAHAGMLYQALAPTPELVDLAVRLSCDPDLEVDLRCRAVESLAGDSGRDTLVKLFDAAAAADLQVRRAAASALGRRLDRFAVQPLQTAAEVEREPLARGFALVSLGRQQSDEGRQFLLHVLQKGKKTQRSWAALGLAIAVRNRVDDEARVAIRAGFRNERNQSEKGAYALAIGIAKDREAIAELRSAIDHASDAMLRCAAATALGAVGGDEARALLKERALQDVSCVVRAAAAEALGEIGVAADGGFLAEVLAHEPWPEPQASALRGMAKIGNEESCRRLLALLAAHGTRSDVRRHAIESLGRMLSRTADDELARLGRQSNYTVYPDWLVVTLRGE
jgi:HEAT repeat protein